MVVDARQEGLTCLRMTERSEQRDARIAESFVKRADFQKRRVPEIGANPIEQTVADFVGDHVSGALPKTWSCRQR